METINAEFIAFIQISSVFPPQATFIDSKDAWEVINSGKRREKNTQEAERGQNEEEEVHQGGGGIDTPKSVRKKKMLGAQKKKTWGGNLQNDFIEGRRGGPDSQQWGNTKSDGSTCFPPPLANKKARQPSSESRNFHLGGSRNFATEKRLGGSRGIFFPCPAE